MFVVVVWSCSRYEGGGYNGGGGVGLMVVVEWRLWWVW